MTVPANSEATITEIKSISNSFERNEKSAIGDDTLKPKEEIPVSDVTETNQGIQPVQLINPNEGSIALC